MRDDTKQRIKISIVLLIAIVLLVIYDAVKAQDDQIKDCLPARETWAHVDIYAVDDWLPRRQSSDRQLDGWWKLEGKFVKWLGYGGAYDSPDRDRIAEMLGVTAGWEGINLFRAKPHAVIEVWSRWGVIARLDIASVDDGYFVVMTYTTPAIESGREVWHGAGCQWFVEELPE